MRDRAFHTCGIGVSPDRAAEGTPFIFTPDLVRQYRLTNNLSDFVDCIEASRRDDVMFVIAGDGVDRGSSTLGACDNIVSLQDFG